ncbi:MAG: hypothetical protein Q7S31_00855 [bacterium]|nr:hypothetical protein [bacterium]
MAIEVAALNRQARIMCWPCARLKPDMECELVKMDIRGRNRHASGRLCAKAERMTQGGRIQDMRLRISDAEGNPGEWIWASQLNEKSATI